MPRIAVFGAVVLLGLVAAPCRAETPYLKRVYETFAPSGRFEILGLHVRTPALDGDLSPDPGEGLPLTVRTAHGQGRQYHANQPADLP